MAKDILRDGSTAGKTQIKDRTGVRNGRLVAIEHVASIIKTRRPIWRCICDCGNFYNVEGRLLGGRAGVKSCGCLVADNNRKHRAIVKQLGIGRACGQCGAFERNSAGDCMACRRESQARFYVKNKASINASALIWRRENPEKQAAANKAWRDKNPEKRAAAASAWAKNNPESRRASEHNRRARKNTVGGKLSGDLAKKLFKLQKGKCPCCAKPLGNNYHMDHINPLSMGGSNTDDNIQLLRQRCNNQKHTKHPIDFMQSRGFLL